MKTPVAVPAEVMAGLEAARVSGRVNMLEWLSVVELAREMGEFKAADWIWANRSAYIEGVFNGFIGQDDKGDA